MKKLFKCSVCGFIAEGEVAPEKCAKCGAPREKFEQLAVEDAQKVYMSDRTNDIHMEIIVLVDKITNLCKEGIELKLDPGCISVFEKAKDEVWTIKQRSKAEMQGHMNKGKW